MIQDAIGNLIPDWVDVRDFIFYLIPNFGPHSQFRACNETQGDPSAPQCGFSNMACQILNAYGEHRLQLSIRALVVLDNPHLLLYV